VNDEQLRAVVDAAIARHFASRAVSMTTTRPPDGLMPFHSSHARFPLEGGVDTGGACLIEPSVECVHCGYCQSHGH